MLRLVLSAGELGGQALALVDVGARVDVVAGCPEVEVFVVRIGRARERRARHSACSGVKFGTHLGDNLSLPGGLGDGQRGLLDGGLVRGPTAGGVDCAGARRVAGRAVEVQWLCGRDIEGRGFHLEQGGLLPFPFGVPFGLGEQLGVPVRCGRCAAGHRFASGMLRVVHG